MAIKVDEQTEAILKILQDQAQARNIGLAEYLRHFAEAGEVTTPGDAQSLEEFEALIEQLSEGLSLLPRLPMDFSRQDIYAELD